MRYEVSILSDAEVDIDEAFLWYELRQIDLGDDFFKSVNESVLLIAGNPFISEVIYRGIRRFVIKKFPYGIYYKVIAEERKVQIIGVIHFKRNARLIKGRIKSGKNQS